MPRRCKGLDRQTETRACAAPLQCFPRQTDRQTEQTDRTTDRQTDRQKLGHALPRGTCSHSATCSPADAPRDTMKPPSSLHSCGHSARTAGGCSDACAASSFAAIASASLSFPEGYACHGRAHVGVSGGPPKTTGHNPPQTTFLLKKITNSMHNPNPNHRAHPTQSTFLTKKGVYAHPQPKPQGTPSPKKHARAFLSFPKGLYTRWAPR
jgi:hypothetical protein